jgi:hypothetical protein
MSEPIAHHGARRGRAERWNYLLVRVCQVLLVFVLSHVVITLANIPRYYQRVSTLSVPTVQFGGEIRTSNDLVLSQVAARGMSPSTYAAYIIGLNLIIALPFLVTGLLIASKAQRNWYHWFTAFVLVFYPTGSLWEFSLVGGLAREIVGTGSLLWSCYLLFLYLFPNGRAAPRWSRWIMGLLALLLFIVQAALLALDYFSLPYDAASIMPLPLIVIFGGFPLILACQIYRYFWVANTVERTQVKWFVAGIALLITAIVATTNLGSSLTSDTGFVGDATGLLAVIIPLTIGISILRYRLWDIDIIIRRTLVYSLLTLTLGLVYVGGILLSRALVAPLTGGTEIAIVASTLAIAALFMPLRRRIQNVIDKRFYRRKYDAAKVLAAFGATARDETNLDALTGGLLRVVDETMQPEFVGLWLRDPSIQARGEADGAPQPHHIAVHTEEPRRHYVDEAT